MPKSPTYSPPTLAEFRTMLARTLRDPDGAVFGVDALNDFIAEGMMSLDGYRPVEAIELMAYDPGLWTNIQYLEPTLLTNIWQVVAMNDNDLVTTGQHLVLPYGNPGESPIPNGWDYYGGRLNFGRWLVAQLNAWNDSAESLTLIMYGYRDRDLPVEVDDDTVLDLEDAVDQLCLTRECRALGFQLLNNDRALYQQWLAATNNTDVSPTQIQGMLSGAVGDVERQRKRSAIIRRQPTIGPQYP